MQPRIEILPQKKLVGNRLRMSIAGNRTPELWRTFMPGHKEIVNRADNNYYSLEIYEDVSFFKNFDPLSEFDKWAGVLVDNLDAIPFGFESLIIPPGLYAVFDYKGSSAEAEKFYRYVFSEWLPASDFYLDNRPHFAVMGKKYKNNSPDSEEEIWIPVREKTDHYGTAKTKVAVEIFDRFAQLYQEKFMDVSSYGLSLDIFCNLLTKPDATMLELACGPGNITKYLLNKKPGLQIHGTDLSAKMIEFAQQNNPTATFSLMDCRDLNKLEKKYDGIVCGFAFPYLSKEEAIRLIHEAAGRLVNGGVLYISTMEDQYSKSGWETSPSGNTIFMHYHEAGYLSEALIQSGFEIINLRRQDFIKPDDNKMTDLIIVSKKLS